MHPLETTLQHRSQFHSLICAGLLRSASKVIEEMRLKTGNQSSEKLRDLVIECDSLGFSPLHSAVCLLSSDSGINPALEATTLLLLAGAEVSCFDSFGNTALHWAARSGSCEAIQLLAMHGCPLGNYYHFEAPSFRLC